MNKGIFQRMSSWSQLFFLGLFVFGGLILALLISAVASGGSMEKMQSIDFMRIMQFFQATCLFLLPACLCAYLFHEHPANFLKINRSINIKFLAYSLLLIVAIQPVISFTGYYNNLMTFPESLSGIEKWMREMEDSSNALMEQLLTTNSIAILLLNVLVVAVMAGITEEFFFRGSIQQIIQKICSNGHLAVWITAIVFSAIHLQFYGFVPRLILGAILGYMFLWSGNLWIPVIVHAFNNLLSVLIFHFYHGTPQYELAENFGATGDTIWASAASLVISGVILYLLSKEYHKNNTEEISF